MLSYLFENVSGVSGGTEEAICFHYYAGVLFWRYKNRKDIEGYMKDMEDIKLRYKFFLNVVFYKTKEQEKIKSSKNNINRHMYVLE